MIGPKTYESAVASARQDLEVGSYSSAVATLDGWLASQEVATSQTRHAAHLLIVALACRYAVEERVSEQLKPYIPGLIEAAELLSEDGALAEVKKRLPDPQAFADARNTKDRLEWLGQEGELRELRRRYLHAFLAGDSDQLGKIGADKKESRFSDLVNDKKEAEIRRLIDKPLNEEYQQLYQPIYKENQLTEWKQITGTITAVEEQRRATDDDWRILLREGENSGQVIHPRVAPLLSMLVAAERLDAVDFEKDPGVHLLVLHAAQQALPADPVPTNGNGSQALMEAVRRHVMEQIDAGHDAWADFAKKSVRDLETANIEDAARGLTWLRAYLRIFSGKTQVRQVLTGTLKHVCEKATELMDQQKKQNLEPNTPERTAQKAKQLHQIALLIARGRVLEALLQAPGREVV